MRGRERSERKWRRERKEEGGEVEAKEGNIIRRGFILGNIY